MTNQSPESVIAEVIEYYAGAIGSHWDGCYMAHTVCLAVKLRDMLREPGAPDTATEELESTIYPDYEGLTAAVFERSHEPAFSDDSGGLREARAFAESLVEMYIGQQGMKQLKAERDAATAAVERVRDLANSLRVRYADNSDAAYFTKQFLSALDGAPEPDAAESGSTSRIIDLAEKWADEKLGGYIARTSFMQGVRFALDVTDAPVKSSSTVDEAAHDAEVAAKALEDAADRCPLPTVGNWLRARAAEARIAELEAATRVPVNGEPNNRENCPGSGGHAGCGTYCIVCALLTVQSE